MLTFIKNHPFAVEAFFESSVVLTFSISKEQIQPLIPPCLELDVFNNMWGFIAVAMVQTRELRPKGFPKIVGNDFFLIGYRVFVKYVSNTGKRLRGLYILNSETDKKKMEFLGNIFTQYKYTTTDINLIKQNEKVEITSRHSDFNVILDTSKKEHIPLPDGSPFTDWKEARKFAGPLPFTFSYNQETKDVLIVEGVRSNWIPTPVSVLKYNFSFLNNLKLKDINLANAFIIKNIPYIWKKGKIEKWKA